MIKKIFLFTDASISPQKNVGVGIILCLNKKQLLEYTHYTSSELLIALIPQVIYKTYQSKKSTGTEIQTIIDAFKFIQEHFPHCHHIEIFTDCQTIGDLLGRRKAKLLQSNFSTQKEKVLQNADYYRELISLVQNFSVEIFKIKGHQSYEKQVTIYDKIFAIIDKLSRKKLRSILLNNKVADFTKEQKFSRNGS